MEQMSYATGLEGYVMLLRAFRHDREEGEYEDKPPRWFQWGYVTRRNEAVSWYILIRLPIYVMQAAWNSWDGEPTWHQRVLLFKERLPGGNGVWKFSTFECDR